MEERTVIRSALNPLNAGKDKNVTEAGWWQPGVPFLTWVSVYRFSFLIDISNCAALIHALVTPRLSHSYLLYVGVPLLITQTLQLVQNVGKHRCLNELVQMYAAYSLSFALVSFQTR